METFVVIQGSSFTSIYVAIDVDCHRHLRRFTSIYVNSEAVSNLILVTFVPKGGEGRGLDPRDTMVKTNQKPITLKSMICWSKKYLTSFFELSVHEFCTILKSDVFSIRIYLAYYR